LRDAASVTCVTHPAQAAPFPQPAVREGKFEGLPPLQKQKEPTNKRAHARAKSGLVSGAQKLDPRIPPGGLLCKLRRTEP